MSEADGRQDHRTPPSELLPSIAHQFSVYLGKGLAFDSVFQDVSPDLNINGLDDLLDLHFLLTGEALSPDQTDRSIDDDVDVGVEDFLSLLPGRLRRLRTTTQRKTRMFRGEIRGRVDWQETIQARYRTGNVDDPLFACQLAEETVAIPENLVLWELLNDIENAYDEATSLIPDDGADWFNDWGEDSRLVASLEKARSNVHLSELNTERESRDPVPDRVVRDVLDSRSPLYAEAAELLQRYRRLQNHDVDPGEARELLSRRLFAPETGDSLAEDDAPTFFELYWIFKLLGSYDAPRRNLITQSTNCVATWSVGKGTYELYHDWTGGDELDFGESYFDRERDQALPGEDRYLGRTAELLTTQERESSAVFGHRRPKSRSRRPDFTLLRREERGITDIALGEVKYTRKRSTAANGLEKLYRYLIFARESSTGKYFTTGPDHFTTPNVHGFLCVDEVEQYGEPDGNISILQVGDEIQAPF